MTIEIKNGSFKFCNLSLRHWITIDEVHSQAAILGYSIKQQFDNARWAMFRVTSNEEPKYVLDLGFTDKKLEFLIVFSRSDDERHEKDDIYSLGKVLGLEQREYSWGSVFVGYDDKGGSYRIFIRYETRLFWQTTWWWLRYWILGKKWL